MPKKCIKHNVRESEREVYLVYSSYSTDMGSHLFLPVKLLKTPKLVPVLSSFDFCVENILQTIIWSIFQCTVQNAQHQLFNKNKLHEICGKNYAKIIALNKV